MRGSGIIFPMLCRTPHQDDLLLPRSQGAAELAKLKADIAGLVEYG